MRITHEFKADDLVFTARGRDAEDSSAEELLHLQGPTPFSIYFDYKPGEPGRQYERNGDPGYPDEPAELTIHSVGSHGCIFRNGKQSATMMLSIGYDVLPHMTKESIETLGTVCIAAWYEAVEDSKVERYLAGVM